VETGRPELSEYEARQVLIAKNSVAADPERFGPRRAVGGWVFAWVDRSARPPMGVRTVVVADSGEVGRAAVGESGEQALQRLTGANP